MSLFCFTFPLLLRQSVEESWTLPQEPSPPPITPTYTHTAGCVAGSLWCHQTAGSRSPSMTCGWRILVFPVHLTTLTWVLFYQYVLIFLHCPHLHSHIKQRCSRSPREFIINVFMLVTQQINYITDESVPITVKPSLCHTDIYSRTPEEDPIPPCLCDNLCVFSRYWTAWRPMPLACRDSVVRYQPAHRCAPPATPWPLCSAPTPQCPTVASWLPTPLRSLQVR